MKPRSLPAFRLRGVTLTEMLVVIAVIAVLLALLFPVLGRMRNAQGQVGCLNNLRVIGVGFRGYIQDHKGYAPPHWGNPFFDRNSPLGNYLWHGHIAPYMGLDRNDLTSAIFDCPLDPDRNARAPTRNYISAAGNWSISYGFNYAYLTSQRDWYRPPVNLRFIANAHKLILAADTLPTSKAPGSQRALLDLSNFQSDAHANFERGPDYRHSGMANAVFVDGHVGGIDREMLRHVDYWQPRR